jgi:hypothetical protein
MLTPTEMMQSEFPEALWPVGNDCRAGYNLNLQNGVYWMKQCNVAICAIGRNLGPHKAYLSMLRLNRLAQMFGDYRIAIYTNDNDDDTAEELLNWAVDDEKIIIKNETLDRPFHGSVDTVERFVDMAMYRNKYLDMIASMDFAPSYLIVVDLDIEGFSYEGIATSFAVRNWNAIGSNGLLFKDKKRYHYDSLAFRRLNQPFDKPHTPSEINDLNYARGDTPILVNSCFGGLGIFNYNVVRDFRYEAHPTMCDHVTMCKHVSEMSGKVYLNPSMICLYSTNPYAVY